MITKNVRSAVITDFDGTLTGQQQQQVSQENLATLVHLGEHGVTRVIATGRSLFSARKVLSDDFPIDYLIFSSGAGIMRWPTGPILRKHALTPIQVAALHAFLRNCQVDFMIHDRIPDNHRFWCYSQDPAHPDFVARCGLYADHWSDLPRHSLLRTAACQIIAILEDPHQLIRQLKQRFPGLNIVRTTSPLNGTSNWVEIFPPKASKGQAAAWLTRKLRIPYGRVCAIGNDFNDEDLLSWARYAFVVSNAPDELRRRFRNVRSGEDGGFTEAVQLHLSRFFV